MSGTTLTCPDCGSVVDVDLARREAAGFCPACDYPLFWARPGDVLEPAGGGDTDTDGAHHRAPGTLGTDALVSVPCPACGELNPPGAATCWRCGSGLEPAPPPPPAPIPSPLPEPEVVVVHAPGPPWWWWALVAAAGVVVGVGIGLLIAWWW
ncbi:MAG: hypothetical protein U0Q15_06550 [Kineosporiaceae bacterium]